MKPIPQRETARRRLTELLVRAQADEASGAYGVTAHMQAGHLNHWSIAEGRSVPPAAGAQAGVTVAELADRFADLVARMQADGAFGKAVANATLRGRRDRPLRSRQVDD